MEKNEREKREIAESLRQYIVTHMADGVTPAQVATAAGYSQRHADRIFRAATGKSIGAYIRLLRLTNAAEGLVKGEDTVLDTALSHQYDSHEGFTKAFRSAFGICPTAYRQGGRPIPYFIPYPVVFPPNLFAERGEEMKNAVTVTFQKRPARKMVVKYSKTGVDYWSFCQEQGCDWEGLLLSIPERMDIPAFLSLPPAMIPEGMASGAVGIEVPANWQGQVPEGYHLVEMPAMELAYFQSPPYEQEDDFPLAIQSVFAAYEGYDPALYGYAFDTDSAPVMNFGAFRESGARIAVPVKGVK